jgi:hypothetical protein
MRLGASLEDLTEFRVGSHDCIGMLTHLSCVPLPCRCADRSPSMLKFVSPSMRRQGPVAIHIATKSGGFLLESWKTHSTSRISQQGALVTVSCNCRTRGELWRLGSLYPSISLLRFHPFDSAIFTPITVPPTSMQLLTSVLCGSSPGLGRVAHVRPGHGRQCCPHLWNRSPSHQVPMAMPLHALCFFLD